MKLKNNIKFKCDLCHEKVTSSINLKRHMEEKNRKTPNDNNMDKGIMKSGKEPEFKWSYCASHHHENFQ